MRQISDDAAYNVVVMEEGDTVETVVHWIEDNLDPPMERGSIEPANWIVDPTPGALIIFNAPDANTAILRFNGRVRRIPQLVNEEFEEDVTKEWLPEENEGTHRLPSWIWNMLGR